MRGGGGTVRGTVTAESHSLRCIAGVSAVENFNQHCCVPSAIHRCVCSDAWEKRSTLGQEMRFNFRSGNCHENFSKVRKVGSEIWSCCVLFFLFFFLPLLQVLESPTIIQTF